MSKVICVILVFLSALLATSFAQSNTSSLEDKVVIVVHMQEDSASNAVDKESTVDAVNRMNEIINESKPENVIYSKIVHKVLNLTLKKIYVDKINKDIDSRINIVSQNVFIDYNGDIFSSDGLIKFLNEKGINKIVIVGRVAEGCIKQSTLSGEKLGYEMYIVPDAIIGKSEESKIKAFNKLEKKGVKKLEI